MAKYSYIHCWLPLLIYEMREEEKSIFLNSNNSTAYIEIQDQVKKIQQNLANVTHSY